MTEKRKNGGNFPNLRFPGFEGEWEVKKLGDFAKFSKGKSISKSDIIENGETECIRYGELYTYYREIIHEIKSKTNLDAAKLILSEFNDVIIPASGETQIDIATASCVLKSGVALGGDLNIIKTSNDGAFLSYYLNSKKKMEIAKLSQGISVVHLYSSQLALLKLRLPVLEEQKKIASFIILLSERISTQKKIISKYKSLIRNLREEVLKQKLSFKYNFENHISNWRLVKLKNITQIFDGTHQTPKYVTSGIPFYSVENVTANNFTKTKFISEDIFTKENKRVRIQKGDILMTRIGDIGTIRYIDWDVNASFYVSLALIKRSHNFNSKYLAQYMISKKFQSDIWNRTIHVAFPKKINLSEIGECLVELPSINEQTKIANFLSSIEEKIETEKKILVQYEIQKKYLLANLFI